jgi:hypothetical protein
VRAGRPSSTPFSDPIGHDVIVEWPGGVYMQLYSRNVPTHSAPLLAIPENRVYVSPDKADEFIRDFVKFAHGSISSDESEAPGVEIGSANETYRRVRVESIFGKLTVLVTDGHLPYPYGRETTGYDVANLSSTLERARASGVTVLVAPYSAQGREAAIVEFPGGLYCRDPFVCVILGPMSEDLDPLRKTGVVEHLRIPNLLTRFPERFVWAAFTLAASFVAIATLAALAMLLKAPFVFPPLGATAILFLYSPSLPTASPRSAVCGHGIGILCGYGALLATGLQHAPSATVVGVDGARILATALALSVTAALMILLKVGASARWSYGADGFIRGRDQPTSAAAFRSGCSLSRTRSIRRKPSRRHRISDLDAAHSPQRGRRQTVGRTAPVSLARL